ncbi:MAG: hypothetical protein Q7U33_00240 [Methylotenera sp.]|jgi:hypothetical protein|uniref:hypothetical protein n=1 Tax=Methylotenera sp. TaxID=2051956 RepID=UPI00272041D9|nr:hypothetical protein [Methylotenera sp.]MDO9149788.1 hypothetical protein [Methylotenera sp.]
MKAIRALAIVLLVAGGLALAYGGFTYTKNTQKAKVGPIELSVKETEAVNIPVWAGVMSMVAGAVLLISHK